MGIDLHAHTTASDGSLSPRELVHLAAEIGLSAVAITDHDTTAGWEEGLVAGVAEGVDVVPGVELSTSYEGGRFHLLGYYLGQNASFLDDLRAIQAARKSRNGEIFDNLRELGLPLEEAEVWKFASENGQLGRPHFARAMVARGYVASTQEAFDRFLADGMPAYATKAVLTPQRAIAGIHEAGGVAIWAHPARSKNLSEDEREERLREFVSWGLDGLEVHYSQYKIEDVAWAITMRDRYQLLGTGGSDFHGVSKPTVYLGVTETGGPLPDEVLEELQARRDQIRRQLNA